MKKQIFSLIIIFLIIIFVSQKIIADTHYVNVNSSTPIAPYTSWETAASVIQEAVDVALPGEFVLVTNGIYCSGKRALQEHLCFNRVVVTNNINVKSVNGPESTIIAGKGPLGNYAVRCVFMSAGTLSGFSLSNGHTKAIGYTYARSGGGLRAMQGGTVSNCIIIYNYASKNGGGTYFGTANNCIIKGNNAEEYGGGTYSSTVKNSTIINNFSYKSGGGTCYGAIESCTISKNSSEAGGGGTYYSTTGNSIIDGNTSKSEGGGSFGGTINNCIISKNSAEKEGGGTCNSTINNSAISGNKSETYGGGSARGIINHCTISGNSAHLGGGTYWSAISNSIVYYNNATTYSNTYADSLNYSCTNPESEGNGNISESPKLISTKYIANGSPCIGAGNFLNTTGTDIDGESWKNPPSIGCDEFYQNNIGGFLEVNIISDFKNAVVNHPVNFAADINGKCFSNFWSFGDGTTKDDVAYPSHSWSSTGEYMVVLTAYNNDNMSGIAATQKVNIVLQESATFYVNINNTFPVSPYDTWAKASRNIQAAIIQAEGDFSGGLVLVTNGLYCNSVTIIDSTWNCIGINRDITVRSINGPENTLIVGKGPPGDYATRCVYMSAGKISGFTLSNGYTRLDSYPFNSKYSCGGGVHAEKGGVVTNCIITCNSASSDGGGAYKGQISSCTISKNSADWGGGIYSRDNCTIDNCTIYGNYAIEGGGILSYKGTIKNCFIYGNSARQNGGGIRSDYDVGIYNCIISGNSAGNAAGVDADQGDGIFNCTIADNFSTSKKGVGLSCENTKVYNSIIYRNHPKDLTATPNSFSHCCVPPGIKGPGIVNKVPQFLWGKYDYVDYHLGPGSPCVDAGKYFEWMDTATDLDGNPRIMNGKVNIGAYEGRSGKWQFKHKKTQDALKTQGFEPSINPYFENDWQIGIATLVGGVVSNVSGPFTLETKNNKIWKLIRKGEVKIKYAKRKDKLIFKIWRKLPEEKVFYFAAPGMTFENSIVPETNTVVKFSLKPIKPEKKGWQPLNPTLIKN